MSKESSQSPFSSIVSINPYKQSYVSNISAFLSETKEVQFKKDQYVVSYLNTRSFITSQLRVSKNIAEEDLDDVISGKVYDDLGLDQAIEYKIQYIEALQPEEDSGERVFEVFIVDPSDIKETFEESIQKIKYIDVIVPAPLLLKGLYTREIIESNGVDCFIYVQDNDAFVSIYKEQELLYTKSIKHSFVEMHERFCELYGERIEFDEFINFISKEDLKTSQSRYKTYVIKLYKELFETINDVLTYVKRVYELEKIDVAYVGMQIDAITKIDEIAEVELGIRSYDFDFDYGFETPSYIDQLHILMHLYVELEEGEKYLCNFTTFQRPPKFLKRYSGQLITLIAASLIIAFAYPVTYWVMTYIDSIRYENLQAQYSELHSQKVTREATIKTKEIDKAKVLALLNEEEKQYNEKKATLMKVHEVKVDYPMKSKLLYLITKDLNKFNVYVNEISYNEKDGKKVLSIYLVSTKDKKITSLVEYLTKTYEDKYHFMLEEIKYDDKVKRYMSELKVLL